MAQISIDQETGLVTEQFAVVYAPQRERKRFPEGCVRVLASEREAMDCADSDRRLYPARVIGPSRSSEGVRLYYLVRWLDEPAA